MLSAATCCASGSHVPSLQHGLQLASVALSSPDGSQHFSLSSSALRVLCWNPWFLSLVPQAACPLAVPQPSFLGTPAVTVTLRHFETRFLSLPRWHRKALLTVSALLVNASSGHKVQRDQELVLGGALAWGREDRPGQDGSAPGFVPTLWGLSSLGHSALFRTYKAYRKPSFPWKHPGQAALWTLAASLHVPLAS